MVFMGKWSRKLTSYRASSSWEPDAVEQSRLLPYREPDLPRSLVTVRKLSCRVAPIFLLVTLICGFFLRNYVRYGLPAGRTPPDVAWLWSASLAAGVLFAALHVTSATLVQRRWQKVADRLLEQVPPDEDPTDYLDPRLLKKFAHWPASVSAGFWLLLIFLSLAPFYAITGYRNPLMGPLSNTDPLAIGLAATVVFLALCKFLIPVRHRRYGAWPGNSAVYNNSPSGE